MNEVYDFVFKPSVFILKDLENQGTYIAMRVELEKEHMSTMETKDPSNLSPNGDEMFHDDVYLKGKENTEVFYLDLPSSSREYFSDLYEKMDQGIVKNLN